MPKKTPIRVHSSFLPYNQQVESVGPGKNSKKASYLDIESDEVAIHSKMGPRDDIAVLNPFCDRITLVGTLGEWCLLPQASEGSSVSDALLGLWEHLKTQVWKSKAIADFELYKFNRTDVRDYISGVTRVGTRGATLLVGVGRKLHDDGTFTLRLQFNPADLGKEGLSDVEEIVLDLCDDQIDFPAWLSTAGMTNLDVSCDLLNVEVCDLVLKYEEGHKWRGHHDTHGRLQTWERLRKASPSKKDSEYRSILILYDKRAQLKEAGKPERWKGIPYARLERPLTQTSRKFVSLANLKNPFRKVSIGHVPTEARSRGRTWRQFFASTRWEGTDAASKAIPLVRRGAWRTAVHYGNAKFWSPTQLWSGWTHTLERDGLADWLNRALAAQKTIKKSPA